MTQIYFKCLKCSEKVKYSNLITRGALTLDIYPMIYVRTRNMFFNNPVEERKYSDFLDYVFKFTTTKWITIKEWIPVSDTQNDDQKN